MTKYLVKRDASGEIVDKIPARKGRPPKGYKTEDIDDNLVDTGTKETTVVPVATTSTDVDKEEIDKDTEQKEEVEPPKNSRVYKSSKKITIDQLASIFCNGKRHAGSFLYCDTYSQRHYPKDLIDLPWFKPNMTLGKVEVSNDCIGVWIIDATKDTPDVVIKDVIKD